MKYSVIKIRSIQANKTTILNYLADFNNWYLWSPWACLDPNTKLSSTVNNLSWESSITGCGNMQIVSQDHEHVVIDLNFIKPFKSNAKVVFSLDEQGSERTLVTWEMKSKLPFFLCFFKKLFQVMIGRDFERGLTRLKYLAETGVVPAKLGYASTPQNVAEFSVFGVRDSCHMSNIAESMHESFSQLSELISEVDIVPVKMLSLCDKMCLTKERMDYTAAVVYLGKVDCPANLVNRVIPEHKALKVTLYGSYDFMGDPWAGIYAHFRGLKFKADKRVPPYEIYLKGPHNTESPDEYITEIYMPVK